MSEVANTLESEEICELLAHVRKRSSDAREQAVIARCFINGRRALHTEEVLGIIEEIECELAPILKKHLLDWERFSIDYDGVVIELDRSMLIGVSPGSFDGEALQGPAITVGLKPDAIYFIDRIRAIYRR